MRVKLGLSLAQIGRNLGYDGEEWGGELGGTVEMEDPILVGLAVSTNTANLTTAVFEDIQATFIIPEQPVEPSGKSAVTWAEVKARHSEIPQ